MKHVTQLIMQIEAGDRQASEDLLPLVYQELRRLAQYRLANAQPNQTLQATALVHEAYVRRVDSDNQQSWDSKDSVSSSDDLVAALEPVATALKEIGVNFFVGGNVAASFYGALARPWTWILSRISRRTRSTRLSNNLAVISTAANLRFWTLFHESHVST